MVLGIPRTVGRPLVPLLLRPFIILAQHLRNFDRIQTQIKENIQISAELVMNNVPPTVANHGPGHQSQQTMGPNAALGDEVWNKGKRASNRSS